MFRAMSGVALSLIFTVALRAAEEPKPNTLTPKEIEEGWILLFDGETTFGWISKDEGTATAKNGEIVLSANSDGFLRTTTSWATYKLRFEYRAPKSGKASVILGSDKHGSETSGTGRMHLDTAIDAWYTADLSFLDGKYATFSMETLDPSLSDTFSRTGLTEEKSTKGAVAIGGAGSRFRNIKLKPLEAKSLFNGKDLTGWKKFEADPKRAKSEFSVTKEGWLHLKDGPGDLQTEKEWADFVLQIECFSNGDKLNSGVFFRCRPGEYQNGYEAQIHNGFTDKPEKEYPIEEYDPDSHKLAGTKKVKYQAVDYGTGGIYRRMPARRAVAKDKEWFTMTVVAQGRHIATWVNGVQVVDWTDNRPEDENARNGCKLGKGPISLQGHDATTDLSFRNIRMAELAK